MRKLTFKGYLLFQLKELSGYNTTSLYIFSNLASSNARLQDALTMYLVLYTKEDLKNRLIKKYSYLKTACNQLSGLEENNINDFLNSERLSHYRTIFQNYIYEKDKKVLENKLKQMMYQKICFTRKSKNMSNYRIYKELNLNPGNANAFLKYGDVSKVSLDTARKILAFVNKY